MQRGEEFEIESCKYLNETYGSETITFEHLGGMDSTKPDIAVIKNGNIQYYIEAKASAAQSGQFVLKPDVKTRKFIFSSRNKSIKNEMVDAIIKYMNSNFDQYKDAGTGGEKINMDNEIFSKWIIDHYEKMNVKFVISEFNSSFVIVPIRKFADYFDITATFRIKKSGSREPAKKDITGITNLIRTTYPNVTFSTEDDALFADINSAVINNEFIFGQYTFQLSYRENNRYEVRKLSNTRNKNVIYSIKAKRSQNDDDLCEFRSQL